MEFVLESPEASEVLFASSLDDFRLHPAVRSGRSRWVVTVPADNAFSYFYMVDDRLFLPPCTLREPDDFGNENCIFEPGM